MLTKKDKAWLITEIRQAVREELTVEITWEKRRDEKTGAPLKHPEYRTEDVFLPSFISQQIGFHEGALRGLQEDIDHAKNDVSEYNTKLEVVGKALIGMERAARTMAELADRAGELGLLKSDLKVIEGKKSAGDS